MKKKAPAADFRYVFICRQKQEETPLMLIKTILNKVHKLKSFVYQDVKLGLYQGSEVFNVIVVPSKNGHAICSGCQQPAPGYDRLTERRFEFVPLWGIRVFLLYKMRRVECKTC
ncbi:transposase family protein, partial [Endozoicomonas sp. ALC013]|uniref:transposase family protein n=1 Tax=Endozoicomonas sp. ALC013 TaxID=3403076 RepID=UPI003BB74D56